MWFKFSYYNIKKHPEEMEFNEVWQKHPKEYFKKIINWRWSVPGIPFEGINFAHTWNQTQLVFSGTENNYWVIFRDSPRYDERGKFKLRIFKCHNDHVSCG